MSPLPSLLSLKLLGRCEIVVGSRLIPKMRSRKGILCLAYLALHSRREVRRSAVAEVLWPDSGPDLALYNLRRTLKELRAALGNAETCLVCPTKETLSLRLCADEADVVAFDEAASQRVSISPERIVSLYSGPLMPGWGNKAGEAWVLGEREKRRRIYLDALHKLALESVAASDYDAVIYYLSLIASDNSLQESVCGEVIQSLTRQGEDGYAGRVAKLLTDYLDRMGATPAIQTRNLLHSLSRLTPAPCRRTHLATKASLSTQEAQATQLCADLELSLKYAPEFPLHETDIHRWAAKGETVTVRECLKRCVRDTHRVRAAFLPYTLKVVARLCVATDQFEAASTYGKQALSIFDAEGFQEQVVRTLGILAYGVYQSHDFPAAHAYHQQQLPIARSLGNQDLLADTLLGAGGAAYRVKEHDLSEAYYQEALQVNEACKNYRRKATILGSLGSMEDSRGNYAAAQEWNRQAVEVARILGDPDMLASVLNHSGYIALQHGEYDEARSFYAESLVILEAMKHQTSVFRLLDCFVEMEVSLMEQARQTGSEHPHAERAATLLGVMDKQAERLKIPVDVSSFRSSVIEVSGNTAFYAAYQKGRSFPWKKAVAFCRNAPS